MKLIADWRGPMSFVYVYVCVSANVSEGFVTSFFESFEFYSYKGYIHYYYLKEEDINPSKKSKIDVLLLHFMGEIIQLAKLNWM